MAYGTDFTSLSNSVDTGVLDFNEEMKKRMQTGPKLLGAVGYNPAEQTGMKVATAAPITSAFGSAGEQLRNNAVRTGSNTALAPALKGFAQQQGMTLAPALAGLQQKFGDARREDEKFNVGAENQDYQQSAGNVVAGNSQREAGAGQIGSLAGQEAGIASNEKINTADIASREKIAAEQIKAGRPTTGDYVRGAVGGALTSIAPSLATAGLKKVGIGAAAKVAAPAVAGAAAPVAGAGIGAGTGAGGAVTGTVGGGAGIASALAMAAPLAPLALGIASGWRNSQLHRVADKWTPEQTAFDDQMAQATDPEEHLRLVGEYMTKLFNMSQGGPGQAQIAKQAMDTFRKYYGDPKQYGINIELPTGIRGFGRNATQGNFSMGAAA